MRTGTRAFITLILIMAIIGYTAVYLRAQTDEMESCSITSDTINQWLVDAACLRDQYDPNGADWRHWDLLCKSVVEAKYRLHILQFGRALKEMDSEELAVFLNAFAEMARRFPDKTGLEIAVEIPMDQIVPVPTN